MKRICVLAAALGLALGLALVTGCNQAAEPSAPAASNSAPAMPPLPARAQPRLQTMKLYVGAETLDTELALNWEQQRTGMMYRTNMPEHEAMLFVFPQPHRAAFWMINTQLPLSAAYIDPEGVILEIHKLEPFSTNSVEAATDRVQYVLETPQGWFERHNVSTGAVIQTDRGPLKQNFTFGR
jgi:uncharacterized membrane protein (UPF0127 family)